MTCTLTTFESLYVLLDMLPVRQSIKLAGLHGIGKSEGFKYYAANRNLNFNVVYLSQCDVTDVKGLPFLNAKDKITEWFKGVWWPKSNGDKAGGLLLLEEFNRARPDVQAVALELALEGSLDGEPLPENWRVVIAVNEFGDYITNTPDIAVNSRFFHIRFAPDPDVWCQYAASKGVHSVIINYIRSYPASLDPQGTLDPVLKYPDRRSWFKVNEAIQKGDLLKMPISQTNRNVLRQICQGWLGEHTAAAFVAYVDANMKDYTPKMLLYEFDKHKEDLRKETSLHDHMLWMKNAIEYLHQACIKESDALQEHKDFSKVNFETFDMKTFDNIIAYSDLLAEMGMREVASANCQLVLSCLLTRAPWDKQLREESEFFQMFDKEFDPELGIPELDMNNKLDRYIGLYLALTTQEEQSTTQATSNP